jgi:hypothetical protein
MGYSQATRCGVGAIRDAIQIIEWQINATTLEKGLCVLLQPGSGLS